MTNPYFDYNDDLTPGTFARADEVNEIFERIEEAFGSFPAPDLTNGGFLGALVVGLATDDEHAMRYSQFKTWDVSPNANNRRITNLADPNADGQAANKRYVDAQIAANLLSGGNVEDIPITMLNPGTLGPHQFVKNNAAGDALVATDFDIDALRTGSIAPGGVVKVTAINTFEGVDFELEEAASAIFAFTNF